MQEPINDNSKNWLQLYVDAMTEKDPYKRLAIVRRLRQIPRPDESEESREEPRPRIVPNLRPKAETKPRVRVRNRKSKPSSKISRHARLRRA